MKIQIFGNTGLRVSKFCLGTMTFGTAWGFGAEKSECKKVFHTYLDAGGNFIDTANVYTNGESEEMLGIFLANLRHKFIVSTKYSLCTDRENANSLGNHRRNLVLSVEDSLARLHTEFIDLLWVHAWYFENKVEDVARALDDLITSGKVLYWGLSDTPAWICSEAKTIASLRGWAPLSAIQVEYSLIERTAERELIPFAKYNGLGITGWAPLAGGILTGKHHTQDVSVDSLRANRAEKRRNAKIDEIVQTLIQISSKLGVTPTQLAIAWTLQVQPTSIPIVGARNAKQLEESLKALSLNLDEEVLQKLDDVTKVDLGFPHDMIASPRTQEVMYGPFIDSVE